MKETSRSKLFIALIAGISFVTALVASAVARQPPQPRQKPAPAARQQCPAPHKKQRLPAPPENEEAARGQTQYTASCSFCHGADATGARGPDLLRSPVVAHDVKGN